MGLRLLESSQLLTCRSTCDCSMVVLCRCSYVGEFPAAFNVTCGRAGEGADFVEGLVVCGVAVG